MGMILRIASSRIVGQGDIVGRSGYFSLNLSANSVMRGRLDARRTLKSLVADLRLMKIVLNNIYTLDKYFFIDISMINKTKIRYDIDQIRFKIEDKKQTKATNFQSIEILPLMQVNKNLVFKKNYRNIFVFEKFTFPDEKVLTIEISEKQISGRTITLRIDYADILHADAFTE